MTAKYEEQAAECSTSMFKLKSPLSNSSSEVMIRTRIPIATSDCRAMATFGFAIFEARGTEIVTSREALDRSRR